MGSFCPTWCDWQPGIRAFSPGICSGPGTDWPALVCDVRLESSDCFCDWLVVWRGTFRGWLLLGWSSFQGRRYWGLVGKCRGWCPRCRIGLVDRSGGSCM